MVLQLVAVFGGVGEPIEHGAVEFLAEGGVGRIGEEIVAVERVAGLADEAGAAGGPEASVAAHRRAGLARVDVRTDGTEELVGRAGMDEVQGPPRAKPWSTIWSSIGSTLYFADNSPATGSECWAFTPVAGDAPSAGSA